MKMLAGWSQVVKNRLREWFPSPPLGQRGEAAAARYLRRRGYRIVAQGDRGQLGELDLVAVKKRTVVFVEVKTRQSQAAGNPGEAVDDDKQRRLTRLALSFLKRHGLLEYPARFDIVAVTWPEGQSRPSIEHFEHAFEAVGFKGMFS
ncbi:MAG: YraN family protein [Pirellulales bacterium]